MSTAWRVYCSDCDSSPDMGDITSKDDVLVIIKHSADVALFNWSDDVGLSVGGRNVDVNWVKQHANHRLRAMDEYGVVDGECGLSMRCKECGSVYFCKQPRFHNGGGAHG